MTEKEWRLTTSRRRAASATIISQRLAKRCQMFMKEMSSVSYVSVSSAKHEVNIALAGPLNCGKSAMAVRYLTRRYIGEYDPNIGANCERAL